MIALLLILLGCGQSTNVSVPVKGGEPLTFNVDASKIDHELEIKVTVTNETNEEVTLDFMSGQKYELVLTNESGEELYRFSREHMFTMALVHETLAPGESKVYEETINLEQMEAGPYTLHASLLVAAINGEEVAADTYTKSVEVK